MKFGHMGDCHLGGWQQPELRDLNRRCFALALEKCMKEQVNFIIITGDLFDSAYPPIETLKEAFQEFRKVKEAGIPVFLIAGSHDYAASGKSFLDVLEKGGFCVNVSRYEERKDGLYLQPTLCGNAAIYGYPGRKSGLEVQEIERLHLEEAPGFFRILMLHTALRDAVGNLPIPAISHEKLPKVDYLALSHLHIRYSKQGRVYSGPIFPNNIAELEELKGGMFYIFDNGKIQREELVLKKIVVLEVEIRDALKATDDLKTVLTQAKFQDAIVLLKISGIIEKGKASDLNFIALEQHAKKLGAYAFLKSTGKLYLPDASLSFEVEDATRLEQELIASFQETQKGSFQTITSELLRALQIEKGEEETSATFAERLLSESKRTLRI